MVDYIVTLFAAAYGDGVYGAGAYGEGVTAAAGGSGGGLANTGVMLIAVATVACLLVFLALLTRFWKRKRGDKSYSRNR